jgi:hypothetical protein
MEIPQTVKWFFLKNLRTTAGMYNSGGDPETRPLSERVGRECLGDSTRLPGSKRYSVHEMLENRHQAAALLIASNHSDCLIKRQQVS